MDDLRQGSFESEWNEVDKELREWFFGTYTPQNKMELETMRDTIDSYQSVQALKITDAELFKAMRRSMRAIGQAIQPEHDLVIRLELLLCMFRISGHLLRLESRAKKQNNLNTTFATTYL